MNRRQNLVLVVIALSLHAAGCSKPKHNTAVPEESVDESSPVNVGTAQESRSTNPLELAEKCYSATEEATVALAESKPAKGPGAAAIESCANLFRHERCKAAWLEVPHSSVRDKLGRVFSECAAAYCPQLEDRELASCLGISESNAQRSADFAELTIAVLELEWGEKTARKISARLVQLSTPVLSIDDKRVVLDGVELARVDELPKIPEWRLPSLYEVLHRRNPSGELGHPIKILATKSTSAHHLNLLIKNSSSAGYTSVALCTLVAGTSIDGQPPGEPKEQCSDLMTLGGPSEAPVPP